MGWGRNFFFHRQPRSQAAKCRNHGASRSPELLEEEAVPSAKDRMWLNRSIRGQVCNLQGHKPCMEVGRELPNQGGWRLLPDFLLQELLQVWKPCCWRQVFANRQVDANAEHVLKFDGILPD